MCRGLRLQCGHSIETEEGAKKRLLVSLLLEDEKDGATHVLECLDSGVTMRARLNEDSRMLSIFHEAWSPYQQYTFAGVYLPPLPQHQEHTCTDAHGWVLLAIVLCLVAEISRYGLVHGNWSVVMEAYDYEGKLCGAHADVADKPFAFWCRLPGQQKIDLKHPICVEKCPDSSLTSHQCFHLVGDGRIATNSSQQDYRTTSYGLSPFCWPRAPEFRAQVMQARAKQVTPLRALLILSSSLHLVVPVICVSAAFMGFLYFKLLERCVEFIVLTFIFAGTSGLIIVSGALLFRQSQEVRYHEMGFAAGLLACSCLFLRWLSRPQSRLAIDQAAGCIAAACECINQEYSLILEPLVALFIRMQMLSFLGSLLVLMFTTSEHSFDSATNTTTREVVMSRKEYAYCGITAFVLIWSMEASTSLSQYVLAWVVQRWYFTPYVNDKKLDWERHAVFKGYASALRYHLGSIVWGSLLIAFLRPIRMCLNIFDIVIATLCPGHTPYFFRTVRHINKSAYLLLALTSDGFHLSARSADYVKSSDTFAANSYLNGLQGVFQMGGLILITAASGASTWLMLQVFPTLSPETWLSSWLICLAMAASLPISISYMTLFDMVGDTILFCWSVQQTRYNYQRKHLHAQREHSAGYGGLTTLFFGSDDTDMEADDEAVHYAPMALREMMMGRSPRGLKLPCVAD